MARWFIAESRVRPVSPAGWYGHVRWENDHAIVEDVCGGAANIDGRVYMQQAKKLAAQLKVMRATERELRLRQRPDHEATAIPFADVAC